MIQAVLFDLDDTLYPHAQWLHGAWKAVTAVATEFDADRSALMAALTEIAGEASDRGDIIDRAVERAAPGVPIEPLVEAFRAYRAGPLQPYPGVARALAELHEVVPIGLVSNGDVSLQTDKLRALGLADTFDVVVFSDAYGREHRKPHPLPFRMALADLDVAPESAVFVGDRPDEDVEGAVAAGMRAVRVRTGAYRSVPDELAPWYTAMSLPDATRVIFDAVRGATVTIDLRTPGPRPRHADQDTPRSPRR